MEISENVPLKHLNTFGIDVRARYFAEVSSESILRAVLQERVFRDHPHLVLGGGSNLLFTKDFQGLVIKSAMKGLVKLRS